MSVFDPGQFDTETRSFLGAAAIAILGGIVRALRSEKCSTKAVFIELVTSLFAGIVVWLIMTPYFDGSQWGEYYKAGITGISGHVAPKLLDLLGNKVTKIVGGRIK